MNKFHLALLSTLLFAASQAFALEPTDCAMCHVAADLTDLDADTLLAALTNADLAVHGRFADATEAEVQALLEALKAGK